MRKRNIDVLFDNIFWYLIYSMPILMYVIGYFCGLSTSIFSFFDSTLLGSSNSIVFQTISSIFGSDGILPLFENNSIFNIFSFYINVMIVHLAVDFLLFIPRLCHHWMSKFTSGRED